MYTEAASVPPDLIFTLDSTLWMFTSCEGFSPPYDVMDAP